MLFEQRLKGKNLNLWLSSLMLGTIILLSMIIPPFFEEKFTICLFKHIIGIPCPFCGMTRAFLFLGHGNISEALKLNIVSPILFSITGILLCLHIIQIISGKTINIKLTLSKKIFVYLFSGLIIIGGWSYNLSIYFGKKLVIMP